MKLFNLKNLNILEICISSYMVLNTIDVYIRKYEVFVLLAPTCIEVLFYPNNI